VLIITVLLFGIMAVWVTVQGARDIKSMLSSIRQRHEAAQKSPPGE